MVQRTTWGSSMTLVVFAVLLPFIIAGPGYGFARWLNRNQSVNRLQFLLDSAWIGMALTWLNVALIREFQIGSEHHTAALLLMAAAWLLIGLFISRGHPPAPPMSLPERVGGSGVLLAVAVLSMWRASDIARPLHGYWHLEGADEWRHEALPIRPDEAAAARVHGNPDAPAYSLHPIEGPIRLQATDDATGTLIVAIQGPIGSTLRVGEQVAVVQASMEEKEEEGPVRRYLKNGVAGLLVPISLTKGESVQIHARGERVFVMPGADALWALHAEGTLRYTHYYQILNQVENQVWAQEMLSSRRFTLHQPPGWSPLLSTATVLLTDDIQAGSILFLWVLVMVGLSAVRLCRVLAPTAPLLAYAVPGGMLLSHGLLMLEPGSQNFPDSLYAASILAVAGAIASGRHGWIAALGIAAGLLRWPGVIVTTMFILAWWRTHGSLHLLALKRLWGLVFIGAILATIGVYSGEFIDLLFILYFETFPEHWHDNYTATSLIPRIPGFYALWTAYTGGGLMLAIFAWWTPPSKARSGLRWLLGSIGTYSLLLCTIDHHPTHYFLPLIGITGVAVVCASASIQKTWLQNTLLLTCLFFLLVFLWNADVGLQPIENMVEYLASQMTQHE
jgi:hypothetical protein